MIYHEALLKNMRVISRIKCTNEYLVGWKGSEIGDVLMDGWRDSSMKKKSNLGAVDSYFSLRIVEWMPILPRYV